MKMWKIQTASTRAVALIAVVVASGVVAIFPMLGIGVTDTGIVTLIVVVVAVVAIFQKWKLSRMAHTLRFIEDYNNNPRVDDARRFLRSIRGKGNDEQIKEFDEKEENRADFVFLANKFEILAIGLEKGIYDESLIDAYFEYDIHKAYSYMEVLIEHIRRVENDPKAFSRFKQLAADNRAESVRSPNQS